MDSNLPQSVRFLGSVKRSPIPEMEEHIRKSDGNSTSMPSSSSPLGRVVNTLLSSRSRQLEAAVSHLGSSSQRSSGALLDDSLCYLQNYVRDAVEKREPLDQILIPMIEHSLKAKGSKQHKQVLILLNWLFQDDLLFKAISSNLAEIIMRKEDHYISLGWCTLVRGLIDHELTSIQFSDRGTQEKRNTLLKTLCQSIFHLSTIISKGSTLQDGFELPTRLSVAAADCILVFTEALTKKAPPSDVSSSGTKPSNSNATNRLVNLVPTDSCEKERNSTGRLPQGSENMEMDLLLWDHMDELTTLVQKLQAWSRKSRPLHAKGLERVLKWLQDIRGHYGSPKDEAGGKLLKTGVLLLSSCWRRYVMLLFLEDHRFSQRYMEMLDQYLSAIQFYTQDNTDEHPGKTSSGMETRKFFLNCMSLLWGRFDSNQFEIVMSERGPQISNLLLSQLHCTDEDVIEGALSILRAIIFKTDFSSTGSSLLDSRQIEAALPSLLNLLDERDSAARAVVLFYAEFCSLNPDGQCLQEIFKRLDFGNQCQRRNAIDVISEFVRIYSDSGKMLPPSVRKDIAEHLLDRLGDEEIGIRVQASNLIPEIGPPLVLPALLWLVYSPDERVQSSASDAVVAMLKRYNQNFDVIAMLLDGLSNLSQSPNLVKTPGQIEGALHSGLMLQSGSKLDADLVLRLIPKWSESVQDWSILIEPLIDKMFSDPSNAIIVRFLSYISEHLAEAGDVVLYRILFHAQGQKEMDENLLSKGGDRTFTSDDSVELKGSLFNHLCPLLIIRLLPLRIFNDLNSSIMYGQLLNQDMLHDNIDFKINNYDCVATLLITRAFHLFEFEDVRKLAAELCGRLHPQVLLPIIGSLLDNAAHEQDILKLKTCLFAVCTSLMVRGRDSALHRDMVKIRKILEMVLFWPSVDGDEVSKAQHGCIDCLALMICAELQAPGSSKDLTQNKVRVVGEQMDCPGNGAVMSSVLTYVIQRLICDKNAITLTDSDENACHRESQSSEKTPDSVLMKSESLFEPSIPLSFRLCMANVLISACQKISSSGKHSFACRALPELIHTVEVVTDSVVRAACLQVLFSAVYHLKSAVLPHSPDLFKLSIKALRKGSEKERVAGAKLMASLMASEDVIIESISSGLLEAKSVLVRVSSKDSSPELRQLCEKLLLCITPPLDDILRSI